MSDEWVLVPLKLSEEMQHAIDYYMDNGIEGQTVWTAVIDAAPPTSIVEGDLIAENQRLRYHMRRVIAEREIYRAALDDIAYWPAGAGDLWKKRAANAIEQAMQK